MTQDFYKATNKGSWVLPRCNPNREYELTVSVAVRSKVKRPKSYTERGEKGWVDGLGSGHCRCKVKHNRGVGGWWEKVLQEGEVIPGNASTFFPGLDTEV